MPGTRSITATWLIAVPVNLALGLLAYLPLTFAMMAARGVLETAGWLPPADQVFRDGAFPVAALTASAWLVFVPVAVLANHLLARRSPALPWQHALAATALILTPYTLACTYYGTLIW